MLSFLGTINMVSGPCYTCMLCNDWSVKYILFYLYQKKETKVAHICVGEKMVHIYRDSYNGKRQCVEVMASPGVRITRHPLDFQSKAIMLSAATRPWKWWTDCLLDHVKWSCDQSCPRWAAFCPIHQVREWGGCQAINHKMKVMHQHEAQASSEGLSELQSR